MLSVMVNGYASNVSTSNGVDSAEVWIPVIISLVGVIVSIVVTTFIAGSRYGMMNQTLNTISERLARIEGLFEFKLKE